MQKPLVLYSITAAVFFIIDMIWLGVVAKSFYRKEMGHLLRNKVQWPAAIFFYLIYIVGIVYFALIPAVDNASLHTAALNGALFGFFTYATYDLTNLATLKYWPIKIAVADILWGIIISAVSAASGYSLYMILL